MHETWLRKHEFPGTTNTMIDEAYNAAREAGATGGKILGAGAGGFMILVCPEEMQRAVRERLSDLLFVLARAANDDGRDDILWVPGGKAG